MHTNDFHGFLIVAKKHNLQNIFIIAQSVPLHVWAVFAQGTSKNLTSFYNKFSEKSIFNNFFNTVCSLKLFSYSEQ